MAAALVWQWQERTSTLLLVSLATVWPAVLALLRGKYFPSDDSDQMGDILCAGSGARACMIQLQGPGMQMQQLGTENKTSI